MDIIKFINEHIAWSRATFGEDYKWEQILNHIDEELREIEEYSNDVWEWIDVIFLALDGAWRAGYTAEQIIETMQEKQKINFSRKWTNNTDGVTPNKHIK